MAHGVLHRLAPFRDSAPRYAVRAVSSWAITVLALAHSGAAPAGDVLAELRTDATPFEKPAAAPPALSASMLAVPRRYRPLDWPETARSPPTFQRPRGPREAARAVADQLAEAPMLPESSVWQRMAECRANNRVRLVNLWISGDSSVSLQAGRRGEPSLQWIYYPLAAHQARRGLLDALFATPLLRAVKTRPAAASVRRQGGRP